MVITKSTGLVATYFDFSSTAWEDMVAYYTYKEGESVDIATIKKTILIPRSSRNAPKSLVGEQIKLKYWNKEQSKYEDEFPKALILDGFYWEWDLEKKGCFSSLF